MTIKMAQAGREGNSAKTRNVGLRKRKLCNGWVLSRFDETVPTDASLLGRAVRKKTLPQVDGRQGGSTLPLPVSKRFPSAAQGGER